MKIGILGGTGQQGSGLAIRLANAGYEVIIGSRSTDRGKLKAEQLCKDVDKLVFTGGDNAFACSAAVIILAVPFQGIQELLDPILPLMKDKIIFDLTVNLIPGKYFKIGLEEGKSSYEYLRDYLPGKVVACMKTISANKLHSGENLKEMDFQMSTSDDALQIATEISSKIGLIPVHVKGKFHSSTIERMVALAIQLNKEYKGSHIGYFLTNLQN